MRGPQPRPPPPSFTGMIFVTGNGDLPLATQRRVESIASDRSCPSPSLDRIYQLGLWSAIFFAISLRLPPNKFLRIPLTFHQFRSGWLCYFCYFLPGKRIAAKEAACADRSSSERISQFNQSFQFNKGLGNNPTDRDAYVRYNFNR